MIITRVTREVSRGLHRPQYLQIAPDLVDQTKIDQHGTGWKIHSHPRDRIIAFLEVLLQFRREFICQI